MIIMDTDKDNLTKAFIHFDKSIDYIVDTRKIDIGEESTTPYNESLKHLGWSLDHFDKYLINNEKDKEIEGIRDDIADIYAKMLTISNDLNSFLTEIMKWKMNFNNVWFTRGIFRSLVGEWVF